MSGKISFGLSLVMLSSSVVFAHSRGPAPTASNDSFRTAAPAAEVDRVAQTLGASLAGTWSSSRDLSQGQMARIRNFAATELSEAYSGTRTVLYPFGGPDFLYPHMFFPNMNHLILIGLEPVGSVPSLADAPSYAGFIASAHRDIAAMSFNKTYSMNDHAGSTGQLKASGVAPLLLAQLAVAGMRVTGVGFAQWGAGALSVRSNNSVDYVGGDNVLQIDYQRPDGGAGQVTYLNVDLGNGAFRAGSQYVSYLERAGIDAAFYKAASYASHDPDFSNLNEFVSSHASYLIQADNGLPAPYFVGRSRWSKINLYGIAMEPAHPTFSATTEPELLSAYASSGACQDPGAAAALARFHPGAGVCARGTTRAPGVEWRGRVPFDYDYNTVRDRSWGVNLIYGVAR